MKVLKWLLIVIAVLALIVFGGGYLISPKFTVTRSTVVDARPDKVYPLLATPRAWKQWSVWNQRDPAMQITYTGPESGAGAAWEWKSKSEGDGKMTMTAAEPNKRVAFELYFPDFDSTSQSELSLVPEAASAAPGLMTRRTVTATGESK